MYSDSIQEFQTCTVQLQCMYVLTISLYLARENMLFHECTSAIIKLHSALPRAINIPLC